MSEKVGRSKSQIHHLVSLISHQRSLLRKADIPLKKVPNTIIGIYMVVRIDISNLPSHLPDAIINEISLKKRSEQGKSPNGSDR